MWTSARDVIFQEDQSSPKVQKTSRSGGPIPATPRQSTSGKRHQQRGRKPLTANPPLSVTLQAFFPPENRSSLFQLGVKCESKPTRGSRKQLSPLRAGLTRSSLLCYFSGLEAPILQLLPGIPRTLRMSAAVAPAPLPLPLPTPSVSISAVVLAFPCHSKDFQTRLESCLEWLEWEPTLHKNSWLELTVAIWINWTLLSHPGLPEVDFCLLWNCIYPSNFDPFVNMVKPASCVLDVVIR